MRQEVSGEQLRALRQAAGLDLAVLARRVSLSPAQLRELENNENSLFYTPAIRSLAARKVMAHLGGRSMPLPSLMPPTERLDHVQPPSQSQTTGLAVSGSSLSDYETVPFEFPQPIYVRESVADLPTDESGPPQHDWAGVSAAEVLSSSSHLSGRLLVNRRSTFRSPAVWLLLAAMVAVLVATGVFWIAEPISSLLPRSQSRLLPNVVPAQEPLRANLADLRHAEKLEPHYGTEGSIAHQESDLVAMSPLSGGPAKPAIDEAISGQQSAASFTCPELATGAPVVTLPPAIAQGRVIHLASSVSQVVCVLDGSGRLKAHILDPDQPKSITGPPPWTVQAKSLEQLRVFFQGTRLPVPVDAQDRVKLIELR